VEAQYIRLPPKPTRKYGPYPAERLPLGVGRELLIAVSDPGDAHMRMVKPHGVGPGELVYPAIAYFNRPIHINQDVIPHPEAESPKVAMGPVDELPYVPPLSVPPVGYDRAVKDHSMPVPETARYDKGRKQVFRFDFLNPHDRHTNQK
jgi:hypothetical protein